VTGDHRVAAHCVADEAGKRQLAASARGADRCARFCGVVVSWRGARSADGPPCSGEEKEKEEGRWKVEEARKLGEHRRETSGKGRKRGERVGSG